MTEPPANDIASDQGPATDPPEPGASSRPRRLPPIPDALPEIAAPAAGRGIEKDIFGREPVGHPDWSHRRGEPRVFALIWMLYLMGVTITMFASFMHAQSISQSVTRPAAQRMILATMLGVTLLWPAIRMSQRPARAPVRSVLRDLFVILVPAQAVIWPHAMGVLAGWPIVLLLALACSFGAWSLVVGGLIAFSDATRRRIPGWVWMGLVLAVGLGAPLLAIASGDAGVPRPDSARPGWMLSPATTVLELTRDRSAGGPLRPVFREHWRLIGAVACVGGALLLIARAMEVASRRRDA